MSLGDWGIVAGLLVMLGVFFVCMEILYHRTKTRTTEKTATPLESGQEGGSGKHAA